MHCRPAQRTAWDDFYIVPYIETLEAIITGITTYGSPHKTFANPVLLPDFLNQGTRKLVTPCCDIGDSNDAAGDE